MYKMIRNVTPEVWRQFKVISVLLDKNLADTLKVLIDFYNRSK